MVDEQQAPEETTAYAASPESPAPAPKPKTSGMAIWSLVMAFLCAPIGLILGIVAIVQIGREPQRLRGSGLAIAGTALGAILTLILPFVLILGSIAVPSFIRARETSRAGACVANLKQIASAKEMWAMDNKKGEGAMVTMSDIAGPGKYMNVVLVCPSGGTYTIGKIWENPTCSIGENNTSGDSSDDHVL